MKSWLHRFFEAQFTTQHSKTSVGGHGELIGTLVPLGDGCRNVNKNLPLFGSLLIKNCISIS